MTAKELLTALKRQEVMDSLRCLGCGYEHRCSVRGCAINRAAAEMIEKLAAENESLRNPPNSPLTLEELREMEGEPVWITRMDGSGGVWMLVDTEYALCREAHGEMAVFENCGKTWLACRRRPEGNVSSVPPYGL